ncbi:MAG: hypothetical protein KC418_18065 [Anaerolineales bacterium]|nr:hypothetical protein [Anaerolineales bacterium]
MARTALSTTQVSRTGVAMSPSAANVDGHSLAYQENLLLYVANGGGSPITVTIQTPGTVDGLAVADRTVTIPAGSNRWIGPFPKEQYRQSDGSIYVDFSGVTSVTVAAIYH